METRKFQADTMMAALQQIQAEMGPDALVLSVREVHSGLPWQGKRGVEVVAVRPDLPVAKAEPAEGKADLQAAKAGGPAAKPARVVRPAADGKGFAFDEEVPEIEWEAEAPLTKGAARENGRTWQPQIITREEKARINREALFRGETGGLPRREPPAGAPEAEFAAPAAPAKTAAPAQSAGPAPLPKHLQALYQQLRLQGLEKEPLDGLMAGAARMLPPSALQDEELCAAYVREQLESEVRVLPSGAPERGARVVVLVGGSGSGKTSTAGKLAFLYTSLLGKKVHWVSADTIRTGAIAETRAYTDALGIPLHLIYTPEDFALAAPAWEDADLVLVDTPGFNPCREEQMVQLGALLTQIPRRCTYLVASANTKESDLAQTAASMGLYSLQGVIFTRLDETFTYGSVYNLARSSLLPMAFFASGKGAHANLEVADASRLVDALLGKGWAA